jgi:hypothetical protein
MGVKQGTKLFWYSKRYHYVFALYATTELLINPCLRIVLLAMWAATVATRMGQISLFVTLLTGEFHFRAVLTATVF